MGRTCKRQHFCLECTCKDSFLLTFNWAVMCTNGLCYITVRPASNCDKRLAQRKDLQFTICKWQGKSIFYKRLLIITFSLTPWHYRFGVAQMSMYKTV